MCVECRTKSLNLESRYALECPEGDKSKGPNQEICREEQTILPVNRRKHVKEIIRSMVRINLDLFYTRQIMQMNH
jgi:hypothetical protein